ncbi:MAG: hypothetical protein R3Y06_03750 [Faecalibacterium sp.]
MHKYWFIGIVFLCCGAITLSCIWLIAPTRLAAEYPVHSEDYYLLTDAGGYLCVVQVTEGALQRSTDTTDILVNLLSEQDALRIKAGYRIDDTHALAAALSALRDGASLSP